MNVLELQAVSVRYRERKIRSLKEAVIRGMKGHPHAAWFYSLREVSLTVGQGQSVGVVGANGAGKSTLLRVAAGITSPSAGVAITRGTIAPVMELGTGFEAELSGRENIFFNGALLGRSRRDMRARIDEIISLSGLEDFIDAPLRTYSTGMVARLAFAVATTIDAETILLDEILAVGDASFQRQCNERIERFVHNGATVVLVSHDLDAIQRLCSRSVWIADGRLVADGETEDVLARYRAFVADRRSVRQSSAAASA
ncbi:MAG TPA: ABC transporter ATP-binding protein [Thermoanaerobaculia bacterium]|jgi:ABC-type polysaccharide/polyol phosphate transport system ATPase subunit|nr:ABC transporter ATP-binding protein [Thermoanaerobaculia bacterium]